MKSERLLEKKLEKCLEAFPYLTPRQRVEIAHVFNLGRTKHHGQPLQSIETQLEHAIAHAKARIKGLRKERESHCDQFAHVFLRCFLAMCQIENSHD